MKKLIVVALVIACAAAGGCKRHKKHVDAGVEEADGGAAVDAGTVVDAGAAKVVDAGVAAASTGPDDAAYIVVSGPVERDAAGAWKLGLALAPAPPGQKASLPAGTSQIKVVVSAPSGSITSDIPTQFDMQGIKAVGPISEGTSGTIMPTTIRVPSDAITLSITVDGKTQTTLLKKPKSIAIQDLKAKPGNGVVDVSFGFDPKAPASWALYVEKRAGEWLQVASGDDSKTTATVPPDVDSGMADIGVRLDVTDGFVVVSQTVRSPRPKDAAPIAATDGGSIVSVVDAGP